MNNDLISREALNKALTQLVKSVDDCYEYSPIDFRELIDNAPTVEPFERIGLICEENCGYRPQGDIRWTDKLSVKSNGDIIDFEGRVVGHIDLEVMKGGADNEHL